MVNSFGLGLTNFQLWWFILQLGLVNLSLDHHCSITQRHVFNQKFADSDIIFIVFGQKAQVICTFTQNFSTRMLLHINGLLVVWSVVMIFKDREAGLHQNFLLWFLIPVLLCCLVFTAIAELLDNAVDEVNFLVILNILVSFCFLLQINLLGFYFKGFWSLILILLMHFSFLEYCSNYVVLCCFGAFIFHLWL